jgi:hypothetical protein
MIVGCEDGIPHRAIITENTRVNAREEIMLAGVHVAHA